MSIDPSARSRQPLLCFFALYLGLAILQTFPLVTRLGRVVPSDLGDPLLNTWILWQNAGHVPFTAAWWNAPIFHPMAGSLALSEHLAGLSPLATPVVWLTASPLAAYDVVFLLSFALAAFGTHLLGHHLTGRHDAAAIAALAFGFSPCRASHLAHLQVLASFWMPLALLGLHGWMERRRSWWLALFGGAWLAQALTSGYGLFYFSVLAALWIGWFVRPARWRAGLAIAAAWVLSAAPLVPILLGYREVQDRLGLVRDITEIRRYSADLLSFLHASPHLVLWGRVLEWAGDETALFPGIVVVALVIAAVASAAGRTAVAQSRRRASIRLGLSAAGAACLVVALYTAAAGPWRLAVGSLAISARDIAKPLTLAAIPLAAVVAMGPRVRAGWRRRSPLVFYTSGALVLWLCSLGPEPRLGSTAVLYKAPYAWLMALPGFAALRAPGRFAVPATLCLAVAAALAFARLVPVGARRRRVAGLAIATAVFVEGWAVVPLAAPPSRLVLPAGLDVNLPVLELPPGDTLVDAAAMYRSMFHHHPIVNGYSGYVPPHYWPLVEGIARQDGALLDAAGSGRALLVVVDRERDAGGRAQRYVAARPGARLVSDAGGREIFLLPPVAPVAPGPAGPALRIRRVAANRNDAQVGRLVDRDPRSWWTTWKPQEGGETLTADLGTVVPVAAVRFVQGTVWRDYPRALRISLSADGTAWIDVWERPASRVFFEQALAHPAVGVCVGFAPRPARFVRLQLTAAAAAPWSMAELAVLGPGDP